MTDRQQLIVNNVDTAKQLILDAERWIWAHPQTGYTEWQAHDYLVEKYEALGYTLVKAGNIPGFYTDVETGKPGPKVAIFGELDALDIANHPESVNGMTHCCGHNAQSAALLGIAAVLKQPYALDGLCGSIRLVVVPAEEMIQLAFREELRQKGIIKYNGGKTEFMYRGLLDGVDMAMMVHGMTKGSGVNEDGDTDLDFQALLGMNGCIAKNIRYKGKSAHAGGAPHMGVNAEYAAMLGLQACNDLRETFQEKDTIRFHPILMGANCAVNIIPDEMKIESYVRGKSLEAIKRENIKVNRALTGAALSMGAGVELSDRPGYAPEYHDPTFMKLAEDCCVALCGRKKVVFDYNGWSTGSSDFGDVTCVMPGVQINAGGAVGVAVARAVNEHPDHPAKGLHRRQHLLGQRVVKGQAHHAAAAGQLHHAGAVGGQGVAHAGHLQKFGGDAAGLPPGGGHHIHAAVQGGADGLQRAGADALFIVKHSAVQVQGDQADIRHGEQPPLLLFVRGRPRPGPCRDRRKPRRNLQIL